MTQTVEAAFEAPVARAEASGTRSGALLAGASAASIVANYVFLLAAGRILGSAEYGSLAALLGILAVVLIPAGALQMAVSREVSRRLAGGDATGAAAFARATLRLSLAATVPLLLVALALAVPIGAVLNIGSVGIVLLAESALVTALTAPVAMGILQGRQRFHALAAVYVGPLVLRLVFLAIAAAAGYRLGGAVVATVLGAVGGLVLALALVREPLRGDTPPSAQIAAFLRYLGPVAVGLVGIALLTHVDILVVKARFSSDDAGAYAAASAFARVGFFLPATILAVLFPRTAARQARGEETEDILGRSLLATIAFCGALALVYAASGVGLVTASFGADFAEGGTILAPLALAMGLYSLAQVLAGYHLSRGETRYAWIVAGGVVLQVAVLAALPTSLRGIVWADVAVAAALVVAHELFVGSSAPALGAGLRRARVTTRRARAVLPEAAAVVAATTLLVCLVFLPVVEHLASTVIGNPGTDSTGTLSWLWQLNHESGYHLLGTMHHTLTGAPFGWDEGNGLNIQWSLPYYPAYLATKLFGEVVALNLVVLAGYVLSGASMYLLTRYLGCSRLVAGWAALVYVVFPWHVARAEHASLLHVEVLVLLLLALVAAARKPTWLRIALVGVATVACWLTSGYYGGMAVVTAGAFALGAALFARPPRRALLVFGAAGAALAASALVGMASVLSGTNRGAGIGRVVGDLSIFGLRPLELVVPPYRSLLLGDRLTSYHVAHAHGSNLTEVTNYLGLLTIALALAWLVLVLRRRAGDRTQRLATAGLVAAFVAGLAFAAPSPIVLLGHELPTPARLMWAVTPAFRIPSRWDPLLMAALVPLAAFGLQAGRDAVARRGARGPLLAAAVVVLAMVVSFLELSIRPVARFRTVPVPAAYAGVERTPPGILAEYPLGYSDIYRLWQRRHGRPLLNGAPAGSTPDQARLALLDPAAPGTAPALALLGVTAVAIHPHAFVDAEISPREPTAGDGYRLVGRFAGGDSVWQVVARPAPAFVLPESGFDPPRRSSDGLDAFPLTSSAGVGALEVRAKAAATIRLVLDAEPPSGSTRVLRVSDGSKEQAFPLAGRTHVSALVAVPRGVSQLLLKTDPAATSVDDAILVGAPRAQAASGRPALRAQLVSADPGF